MAIFRAGERRPDTGRKATTDMMEIYRGEGRSTLIETQRVVQGTQIIHHELQAIRMLIADFYRFNSGRPAPSGGRQFGGMVYAQFGKAITSGIVPQPTGKARADASGKIRGTDTFAATVPHGSFVGNVGMTNAFGYNQRGGVVYKEDGGVPVMLTPGERVFSPQEVKQIGLAKLTAQNEDGRRMMNGGTIYANNGREISERSANGIYRGIGTENRGRRIDGRAADQVRVWTGIYSTNTGRSERKNDEDYIRGNYSGTTDRRAVGDGHATTHGTAVQGRVEYAMYGRGKDNISTDGYWKGQYPEGYGSDGKRRGNNRLDESLSYTGMAYSNRKRDGITYANQGTYTDFNNVPDFITKLVLKHRLTARDPRSGQELFPGVADLAVDPLDEIFRRFHAPTEMMGNMGTVDDSIGGVMPIKVAAQATRRYGTNLLRFNQRYRGFHGWQEYLADKTVHEAGHLLSLAKSYDFTDPLRMVNVPLENIKDPYLGMGEGFAEFLRSRYSTERELFTRTNVNKSQKPVIISDLSDLQDKAAEMNMSLTDILTTKDEGIARRVAPSILHHADREGHFGYLMDNYNEFIRAVQSGQSNHELEEYIAHLENNINKTFIRKQHGGIVRPKYASLGLSPEEIEHLVNEYHGLGFTESKRPAEIEKVLNAIKDSKPIRARITPGSSYTYNNVEDFARDLSSIKTRNDAGLYTQYDPDIQKFYDISSPFDKEERASLVRFMSYDASYNSMKRSGGSPDELHEDLRAQRQKDISGAVGVARKTKTVDDNVRVVRGDKTFFQRHSDANGQIITGREFSIPGFLSTSYGEAAHYPGDIVHYTLPKGFHFMPVASAADGGSYNEVTLPPGTKYIIDSAKPLDEQRHEIEARVLSNAEQFSQDVPFGLRHGGLIPRPRHFSDGGMIRYLNEGDPVKKKALRQNLWVKTERW